MTTAPPRATTPEDLELVLSPVRDALLADARAEAERIVSEATRSAGNTVAEAESETTAAVERARHRVELSNAARAEQTLARLRGEGHRATLETRQQLRLRLIDEVHRSARNIRADTRYPRLLNHLESLARSQLGDGAVIERGTSLDGGITAETGSRRVDYRLTALADRALDTLADDVAELWS